MNALAEAQLENYLKQRQRLLWNRIIELYDIEPDLQARVYTWIEQQTVSDHEKYIPGGARAMRSAR
jgi:hypothetical protein